MEYELDTKDRRILSELERDARQSFRQIGKKVGLSKEVVLYRVRNLEKLGLIRGYLTEIDLYKAGYVLYPLLLKLEEMPERQERAIREYLKKSKYIGWAAKCEGAWDLNLVLITRTAKEVALFFDDFERRYGNIIREKALMHIVTQDYFKRTFGLSREERKAVHTAEGGEKIAILEKEERLLRAIAGDARKPLAEIAKAAGVSPPTALSTMKWLEEQGVIQGYRVFTDFGLRKHLYYKLFLQLRKMNEAKWKALYGYMRLNPWALWATRTIGHYDFSIELEVPSVEEFRKFTADFRERFYGVIKRRDSLMVHEEIAFSYFPLPNKK